MLALAVSLPAVPAGGKGKPAPPSPDIVYLSDSSRSITGPAIRGVALTVVDQTIESSDMQLQKALSTRSRGSIARSPDGAWYAWIDGFAETARIMWARPGGPAIVLYAPAVDGDPLVWDGQDTLAGGPSCSGSGSTILVARAAANWNEALQEYEVPPGIMAIDVEAATTSNDPPAHGSPRLLREAGSPHAFAISSDGRYLVFGSGSKSSERVSITSVCGAQPAPASTLLSWPDFAAARYANACSDEPASACPCNGDVAKVCYDYPHAALQSIDWSPDGSRLAFSVTVGPDPEYPWRDLRVAYLNWNVGSLSFEKDRVEVIDFDAVFGAASSEHSPQWGSGVGDADCQRLAFSQSAGASDGSTMNGQRLYLHDLVTTSSACLDGPREVPARNPRVLDWR